MATVWKLPCLSQSESCVNNEYSSSPQRNCLGKVCNPAMRALQTCDIGAKSPTAAAAALPASASSWSSSKSSSRTLIRLGSCPRRSIVTLFINIIPFTCMHASAHRSCHKFPHKNASAPTWHVVQHRRREVTRLPHRGEQPWIEPACWWDRPGHLFCTPGSEAAI